MSEFVTIFQKDISPVGEIPDQDQAMQFPFPLDSFQREGIYRIYRGENVFITAHTGSGKTVLALYAIAECFRLNKKVIYTSPTKSLSNQKYAEFVEKFGGKDKIGILTGDIKMNPDAPCLIMTTEILRNLLYRDVMENQVLPSQSVSLQISEIGAVIFDEVHYINDPERGRVWEEVFILLPREITLVLLSATIDKPEDFAGWLGDLKQKPIHLIPTSHRVVPLRHYFWNVDRKEKIGLLMEDGIFKNYDRIKQGYKRQDINKIMHGLIENLQEEQLLPVLFFTFSRKKCEKLCQSVQGIRLLNHLEEAEVRRIFHHYMHPYASTYEMIPQYQQIYDLLRRGIAYHHSGLIPILKEIVEIIFGKGLIRVLFATETFAVGVNMPTKTVVFSELEKYDKRGRRYLRTDEYLQMSGRAGRRGLDKVGTVILLPTMELPAQGQMREMMTGKSPRIKSQFIPSYQFILKTYRNEEGKAEYFLNQTLRRKEDERIQNTIQEEYEKSLMEFERMKTEYSWNEEMETWIEMYRKNEKKLGDRFMVIKGKDRKRVEEEQKMIEMKQGFRENYQRYDTFLQKKKEVEDLQYEMEYYERAMIEWKEKIHRILLKMNYLREMDGKIELCERGITATCIGEVDEILLTEMIHEGLLDGMRMEEIVTTLSMFITDVDKLGDEITEREMDIPDRIKMVYRRMKEIGKEWMGEEDVESLQIHIDDYYENCISKDLFELTWIWVNGGTIAELYQNTEMYAGNFVRAMLRLNQVCETVEKIYMMMGRLEMVKRMEGYQERLIRDFTTVSSLYVK